MDDLTKSQFLEVSAMIEKNMAIMSNKLNEMKIEINYYNKRIKRIETALMTYRIWVTVIGFAFTFSASYIFDILRVIKNVTRSFAKIH